MIILFIALVSLLSSSQLCSMTKLSIQEKFCTELISLVEVMHSIACNLAEENNRVFKNYKNTIDRNIEIQNSIARKIKTADEKNVREALRSFSVIVNKFSYNFEHMRYHGYLYHLDYLKGTRAVKNIHQLVLKI